MDIAEIARSIQPYLKVEAIFTPDECDRIIALGLASEPTPGGVWNETKQDFVVDDKLRKVLTSYHPRTPATQWVYKRMDEYFAKAAAHWGISIHETTEQFKFIVYNEGSHFGAWHTDTGRNHTQYRVISASIELSARQNFEGGNLEIYPRTLGPTLRVGRGGGVLFPSFMPHRVTSVTRGQRYALVNWISGPALSVPEDVLPKVMQGY